MKISGLSQEKFADPGPRQLLHTSLSIPSFPILFHLTFPSYFTEKFEAIKKLLP